MVKIGKIGKMTTIAITTHSQKNQKNAPWKIEE